MAVWSYMILFCAFYVGTFITNKYVLSVLSFTFPTIFQCWQTVFGLTVILCCSAMDWVKINIKSRQDLYLWAHGIIFFTISIYAGSKALSVLPVPAFIAVQNMVEVMVFLVQVVRTKKFGNAAVIIRYSLLHPEIKASPFVALYTGKYIAIMITATTYTSIVSDPQYNSRGYGWMSVHVASSSLLLMSQNWMKPASFSDVECLFYQYVFSAVAFIPGSVILGDLTSAQYFPHWFILKFYVGCVLSGLLGVLLNLTSIQIKLTDADILPAAVALSKALLIVASQKVFEATYTGDFLFSLLINMAAYFVFLWVQPVDDGTPIFEESSVKLSKEVI